MVNNVVSGQFHLAGDLLLASTFFSSFRDFYVFYIFFAIFSIFIIATIPVLKEDKKMKTFKEYIEYRATRKNGIKKGTVVLVKIFDAEKDGPWSEEGRGLSRRPYDRTYVEARIGDYLQDKANCREFDAAKFDLTDLTYLIAVVVKKNTKRCNALIEYGFEPAIDLEQKAKALGGEDNV